jgi:acetyl-CoA carboxylase biotin carboxyl carrier protein
MTHEEIVTRLLQAMRAHGVSELSYRDSQTQWRLVLPAEPVAARLSHRPAPRDITFITSPEAGHVRLAHPLRKNRATTGQSVAAGEPICFIESDARLFPVIPQAAGQIAEVLVRDGQRVDYGAPLLLVEGLAPEISRE